MEKKTYVKPVLYSEEFVPQEYIAACGDSGISYLFSCDAGNGRHGDIFKGLNLRRAENLTKGSGRYFHACGKNHTAPTSDVFYDGWYVENGGNDKLTYKTGFWPFEKEHEYSKLRVKIWTGDGDIHATQKLNQDAWETAKS